MTRRGRAQRPARCSAGRSPPERLDALLISAIQSSDTPVVMAITFVYAILVVACNVIADIVYGLLDPRITYA